MAVGSQGTHIVVKVHEVGDHLDVGEVNPSLSDDLLQHVPQTRREDEHGHTVLLEPVEEVLVALPVETHTRARKRGYNDTKVLPSLVRLVLLTLLLLLLLRTAV